MRTLNVSCLVATVGMASAIASAGLVTTRTDTGVGAAAVDGVFGANEYGPGNSYSYTGGGSGFGGTLGAGTVYMKADSTNLYIGFQPGNALNDLVTLQLDTRAGGFIDSTMSDNADGGRRAASDININADDAFPTGFQSDFAIVIGSFGIVAFELTGGSLNFVNFDGTFTGNGTNFREYSLPLSSLAISGGFNFFATYTADSGYGSNESLPGGAINAGANIGTDPTSPGYENYDRFNVSPVPAPASALMLGLGAVVARRRRR